MALIIDNIYFGWWHGGRFLLETTLGGKITVWRSGDACAGVVGWGWIAF